jgi:hypothetical protein
MNLKQTVRIRMSESRIIDSVILRRVTSLVKNEKGDLVADSHIILARWRNNFCQLLNVHGHNDVRQMEIYTED